MKLNVSVGDVGGFAPRLDSNEQAIALIIDAIEKSGYVPGKDVFVALDVAATSMYDEVSQKYTLDGKQVSADELANYYVYLTEK